MGSKIQSIGGIFVSLALAFYMAYAALQDGPVQSLSSKDRSVFNFLADIINIAVENFGSIPAACLFAGLGLLNTFWIWKKMKRQPAVEA